MAKQLNFTFITQPVVNLLERGAIVGSEGPKRPALTKKPAFLSSPKPKTIKNQPINERSETKILDNIFKSLIQDYFPNRLDLLDYRIAWSTRRQKRTLASCNLRARKILVAQELNNPDYHKFLPALIYHELCHAVLGYSVRSETGKSRWHGKEFRTLEQKHPEIKLLNLWIKEGGWRQAIRRHRGKTSVRKNTSKITVSRKSLLSRLFRNFLFR